MTIASAQTTSVAAQKLSRMTRTCLHGRASEGHLVGRQRALPPRGPLRLRRCARCGVVAVLRLPCADAVEGVEVLGVGRRGGRGLDADVEVDSGGVLMAGSHTHFCPGQL